MMAVERRKKLLEYKIQDLTIDLKREIKAKEGMYLEKLKNVPIFEIGKSCCMCHYFYEKGLLNGDFC